MDEEKQAFKKWYSADDTEIENTVGKELVKDTKFSVVAGIVFYGGYHSRDAEIAARKAERDKYAKVLDKVNHILSQYPLAYGINGRMNVPGIVKMMLAEIERKDHIIETALEQLYVDQDGVGSIKEARKSLEQALKDGE